MQSLLGGLGVIRGPQGRFIDDDIGIGNPPFSTVDFSEYKWGRSVLTFSSLVQAMPPLPTFSPSPTSLDSFSHLFSVTSPIGFTGPEASPFTVESNSSHHLNILPLSEHDLETSYLNFQSPVETKRLCGDTNQRTTTLCSVAFRLVARCNRRSIDLNMVYVQMQHGFHWGRTLIDGCRVDNQVLLAVLTEIS